ncbi:hypothetical protein FRC01_003032 [Tulasnella sp. 417]|nr:hypothetical protein FRC01_003032 [Tulasnella sp. 417]
MVSVCLCYWSILAYIGGKETPAPPLHSAEPSTSAAELADEDQTIGSAQREIQQDSKFAKMPSDILLLVINCLGMVEKAHLLATCHYLRQLVEPILYRSLNPDDTWRSSRRIRLLKTLGERQDLLPLIHSFRGLLIPTSISGPKTRQSAEGALTDDLWPKEGLQAEWLAIAVPLYTQAINIRSLDLSDCIAWGENGRWGLFNSVVSGMKLSELALKCSSFGPLDFTPILRRQRGLTRLELDWPTAQFEGLEKDDVPQLTTFKGTLLQAVMIVPGRPVKKLQGTCIWQDECQCVNEHTYQTLALSSEAINVFTLAPHPVPDNDTLRLILRLITQYLPKIVDLAIVPRAPVSAEVLLDEIPKLPSINHLMLSEAWVGFLESLTDEPTDDPGDREDNDWERFSERLKGLCPSLTDVRYTPLWLPVCGRTAFLERLKRRDYL